MSTVDKVQVFLGPELIAGRKGTGNIAFPSVSVLSCMSEIHTPLYVQESSDVLWKDKPNVYQENLCITLAQEYMVVFNQIKTY